MTKQTRSNLECKPLIMSRLLINLMAPLKFPASDLFFGKRLLKILRKIIFPKLSQIRIYERMLFYLFVN